MRDFRTITILIVFLLSSCSGVNNSALKDADAIMEQNPDSALAILQAIDRNSLSARDLPFFALLMTQAQVKTNVTLDSDSLISIAYREYAHDGKGDRGIRSYYYMGEILLNQNLSKDAFMCYLNAYEEAKRLGNFYWRALASGRIADIFFNAYNYEDATKYRKDAIKYFELSGHPSEKRQAEARLTFQERNDGKITDRLLSHDSLIRQGLQEQSIDSVLIQFSDQDSMGALIALCHLYDFELISKMLQNSLIDTDNIEGAVMTASILRKQNKINEADSAVFNARKYIQSNEDRIALLYALYQNALEGDKFKEAITLADSIFIYQEAINNNIRKETINSAHGEFYSSKAAQTQEKARKQILIVVFALVSVCLIAVITWRIMRLKNIAQRAELESKVLSLVAMKTYSDKIQTEQILLKQQINEKNHLVNSLRDKLDLKCTKLENLQIEKDELTKQIQQLSKTFETDTNKRNKVLENLFKEKWKTLNALCEDYYEKGSSKKMKDSIIQKIESEVKTIGSERGLLEIEDEVNKYHEGIVDRLKKEFPSLKKKDIAFYSLVIAGFSTKAICFILDMQSGNFYVKKGRLLKKLSESDSPYKDEFLRRMK